MFDFPYIVELWLDEQYPAIAARAIFQRQSIWQKLDP
jgi:hypothetical protein